jgi:glycosyltransferase involved in cell wall biosynthesis
MRNNSIAVVIPAYNTELHICEALDSVTAQTRLPEQIIVVDDGSSDGTAERVLRWRREYPGELSLLQQSNRGVSAARNTGVRHAKADLIAFLDADDLLLPDHLARLELAFQRHPELLLCFGDALYYIDTQLIIKPSTLVGTGIEDVEYHEEEDGLRLMKGSVYVSLLRGNYISPSTSLVSKSALERIGLFDEVIRNAEDRDLFLRLSLIGPFAYYPYIVAHKRLHENNLTHTRHMMLSHRFQFLVLKKMLDGTENLGLSAKEQTQTKEAMNEHVRTMLYAASSEGVTPYLKTCAYLMRQRNILQVLNPVYLLRALRSLGGG